MNEGLDNSRDVAWNETAHPWEETPKDINEKAKKPSLKTWIKTHKPLAIGAAVAIIAVVVGAVIGIILLIQNMDSSNQEPLGPSVYVPEAAETMTIENALSPELAYEVVAETLDPILMEGILEGSLPDLAKMEDNYSTYVATVESEDDKIMYYLYLTSKMSLLGGIDRAEHLLTTFDEKKITLNDKQRYMYLTAYLDYYIATNDENNKNKYLSMLNEEFPDDEGYYDADTNTIITDKETLRQINYEFDSHYNSESGLTEGSE